VEIQLDSPAFDEGGIIPNKYTADGQDVSPPLAWPDAPEGTQGFALVCEDPDAPRKTWIHWVLFNVPGESRELPEGLPREGHLADGSMQGVNDFGKVGYNGPSPPPRKPHRYYFKLYALDARLPEKERLTRDQLRTAMNGHILAEGQLMGTYGR
jgi:Raf kinase inhibitor-like YbhB/YbcL family protein